MFQLFRCRTETSKQTGKKFLGFAKNQTEKQLIQIEFRFVSVRTEKKIYGFEDPHNRDRFLEIFFGLFQQNSVCFVFFDTGLKQRNKPKKMFFGFAKQTEKQPKQIEFRFVSVRTENKI